MVQTEQSEEAYQRSPPRNEESVPGEQARRDEEQDDGWLEEGLAGLLVLAGVALFLFPEPATSVVGLVLATAGAALWLADVIRSHRMH